MNTLIFDSNNLNKKKTKFSNILKKNYPYRNTKLPINTKKIRSSSIDTENISVKHFSFSNLSPLHNKVSNIKRILDIKTYSNKNIINHSHKETNFLMEKIKKKNENIKKIKNMLDNSVDIFNKNINKINDDNLMQKLVIYLIALDDFIKLLEIKDEKELLTRIKKGIEDIIQNINYNYKKLLNEKTSISNYNTVQITKTKETNQRLIDSFKKRTEYNNINTHNSHFYLKKFFSEKNISNSINYNSRNNKNKSIIEENLSDLESVRFLDKIIMKRTNSSKIIPKLDLSFFSLYRNQISKIK